VNAAREIVAGSLIEQPQAARMLQATPDDMIRAALQHNVDVGELEQLYALKRQFDADEARKAWHAAMAEFKRNPPDIVRDMLNKQYNSSYASIAATVNTTNEALAPHGLNARWDVVEQDKDGMKISCILAHKLGHEERVELRGPMDTSGQKNPLQQVKSTMTYLKIATFEAVTGVASRVGNADDDGNGSGKKSNAGVDAPENSDWKAKVDSCVDTGHFSAVWREMPPSVRKVFADYINRRKAEVVQA
jgi:hypothetical protein